MALALPALKRVISQNCAQWEGGDEADLSDRVSMPSSENDACSGLMYSGVPTSVPMQVYKVDGS
jgi:hypothetical protein